MFPAMRLSAHASPRVSSQASEKNWSQKPSETARTTEDPRGRETKHNNQSTRGLEDA